MAETTTVEVENSTSPTLLTAGIKLPVTELTLASEEHKSLYLFANNKDYDFSDVTDIKLKEELTGITIIKETNRTFKISTDDVKYSNGVNITIVVEKDEDTKVELQLKLTVLAKDNTVNVLFNKDVVDICPDAEVTFDLVGADSSDAIISSIVDPESPLKIDKIRKVLTCSVEGDFINGIVVTKDNFTKIIYIQATSKNIIDVTPNEIAIHTEKTAQIEITLRGEDYSMTSNNTNVCTVDKVTKTITPVSAGTAVISVGGTRGNLTQNKDVTVHVRNVTQPTKPELINVNPEVNGNERLVLNFELANDDKLSARLEDDTKGSVTTELNKVTYNAFAPDDDTMVNIFVKTISTDEIVSEEVKVEVKVLGIPTTSLEMPSELTIKEDEVYPVQMSTNARTITFTSSVPSILSVNSSQRTIKGVNYGSAVLTVLAQAINHKPIEKSVDVTVKPSDLDKPVLKTKVLQVVEDELITLEFVSDPKGKLVVTDEANAGAIELEGNNCKWIAPKLDSSDRQTFAFKAYSVREEVNLKSPEYIFYITVVKKVSEEEEDTGISMSEVLDIVKDEQLTFTEKMNIISKNGNNLSKEILDKLNNYETTMNANNRELTEDQGASKNYELFLAIKKVLDTKDNDTFQALFGLINLYFREYKDDAYSEIKLHRFDMQWAGGDRNLLSYQNIITCICMLCDIMTRKANLRKIDFGIVFDKEKTVFKDDVKENVIKFYTL